VSSDPSSLSGPQSTFVVGVIGLGPLINLLDGLRLKCVIGHGIGGKYIPIMARLAEARRWSKR